MGLAHTCHAMGCEVEVPRRRFMCKKHWGQLPSSMQKAIWDTYVHGQEERMDPSEEYMIVTRRAIRWLATKEGLLHVGET